MGVRVGSLREIAHSLGIFVGNEFQVSGYKIDSRSVCPGDLFFAVKGEKHDGHDFLSQVKRAGAVGAVVHKSYMGPDFGLVLLKVEDVVLSLQALARKSLEGASIQVIGITGSVGKTTTKDFTATLLEGKYRVGKTLQSQNSKLTLPLTVLNRFDDIDVLILEMGMSEMGDIERLVAIAPPDIAVLTKVALAHAAFFEGGLPQIAKGKGAIFSSSKTRCAIFDRDFLEKYPEEVAKIRCEKKIFPEDSPFIAVPFREPHIVHDFWAAASVARVLNMEWDEIQKQIPKLQLPKMRFEQFEKGGVLFINDAYNANPESMRAALFSLGNIKSTGKKIALLGTMKELGSFSLAEHREIGVYARQFVDHLFVLGGEAKPLFDSYVELKGEAEFFSDIKQMGLRLKEIMQKGDAVLIKGSRSMGMETVLDYL